MEPNLTSSLSGGDLATISDHAILLEGKEMLYVGLTVTLYFDHNAVADIDQKLLRCMEEYIRLAPTPPKWASVPVSSKMVDFSKRPYISPSDAKGKPTDGMEWDMDYIWAKSEQEASPWFVESLRSPWANTWDLSYFHVSFPMNWSLKPEFVQIVERWSERLQPRHGYVGAALLLPAAMESAAKLDSIVYIAAQRFPGLNVDYPNSQSSQLHDSIKTVDWMTILGPVLVEKLGGHAALKRQLTPEFMLFPLSSGGLLIQAGVMPQLGDIEKGNRPKLYVDLNRALRPIRVKDYAWAFQSGQYTRPYMDRAAAQAWIARFDDE